MEIFNGKHEGDLEVSGELRVGGLVRGTITVRSGGMLILGGMAESVVVEEGGFVDIGGTVVGSVSGPGTRVIAVNAIVGGQLMMATGLWAKPAPGGTYSNSEDTPRFQLLADGSTSPWRG